MNLATFIRLIFCCILVTSCRQNTTNITFNDIDCYKGTAIENFAKLVEREDTTQMKMYIHKNSLNIDTPDAIFGKPLLMWTIFNGKYKAFRCLLELGANPNSVCQNGDTPLILAAGFIDNNYNTDSRFIMDLLNFGANPNIVTLDSTTNLKKNPLFIAVCTSLTYTKILIEQGHVSPYMEVNGECVLDYPVVLEKLDIVDYLCNEKGMSLNRRITIYGKDDNRTLLDLLKNKDYPPKHEFYKLRQKLLNTYD